MKVLCDVHIPIKLVYFLRNNKVEAEHVINILSGFYTSDRDIANYADENNFIVITKDVDFRNGFFIKKSPQKLIRVCLGNIPTADLITIFQNQLRNLNKIYLTTPQFYIEINSNSILIITE